MQADLHVLFTLDCSAAGPRAGPYGPTGWEASARTIDAFCTTSLNAGFPPTVFVTPEAVAQHTPLCEELVAGGAEVGLLVHPPTLRGAGLKQLLGAHDRDAQLEIVGEARQRFEDALGRRPWSVRSAYFSASDETFGALSTLGFRQASISSPGRRVPKHHADWDGAATDPHFASGSSRLHPGDLPILEVPVTTDAAQRRDGIAPDLAIENGTLDRWHQPLIAGQLARQETSGVTFRALCFVTSSAYPYHDVSSRQRKTLDALLDHMDALEAHHTIVPATLAEASTRFRRVGMNAA
jgi:hypothetical protein